MKKTRTQLARILTRLLVVVALAATVLVAAPEQADARGLGVVFANEVTISACKTPVNSIYGPLWHVTIKAKSNSSNWWQAAANVTRGWTSVYPWSTWVGPGQTRWGSVYMSRLLNDQLTIGIGRGGQGMGGPVSIWSISTC